MESSPSRQQASFHPKAWGVLSRFFARGLAVMAFGTVVLGSVVLDTVVLGAQAEPRSESADTQAWTAELDQLAHKRVAEQKKLADYERAVNDKQQELREAKARYQQDPTTKNEQLYQIAEQRLALAELATQSRISALVRLEKKETELRNQLAASEARQAQALSQQQLAQLAAKKAEQVRVELGSNVQALQRQVAQLQNENTRLRQELVVQTAERERLQARYDAFAAQSLLPKGQDGVVSSPVGEGAGHSVQGATIQGATAQESRVQESIVATDEALGAREKAKAEMARAYGNAQQTASRRKPVALFLRGTQGDEYGEFEYLGGYQYRIDAPITEQTKRFRVGGRLYEVSISPASLNKEFIFLYDFSDAESPRFVTFRKDLLNVQTQPLSAQTQPGLKTPAVTQ